MRQGIWKPEPSIYLNINVVVDLFWFELTCNIAEKKDAIKDLLQETDVKLSDCIDSSNPVERKPVKWLADDESLAEVFLNNL